MKSIKLDLHGKVLKSNFNKENCQSFRKGVKFHNIFQKKRVFKSGAIAEWSRVYVSSGFVVGVQSSNPAWGCFFLNKKKIIFQELDGELS